MFTNPPKSLHMVYSENNNLIQGGKQVVKETNILLFIFIILIVITVLKLFI